jgi:tripeptide aminopeptidase
MLDRFLRYVQVDTQSSAASQTSPTTPGQWDLLRLLERELGELGARDVCLSPLGHLMASLPASAGLEGLPVVAFFGHVDTAPDFCASGVKPIVHRRWAGQPIRLPDDPARVLDPEQLPELRAVVGGDLVTASGTTLLGADDKAGIAIIMSLASHLLEHAGLPHGPLRVCFLPDEEVGRHGARTLDLDRLGANVGYTLDSLGAGEVIWESFWGESATVTVRGVATHPGEAKKHQMVNAVHLAGKLLAALPREFTSPETTEGYGGYLHPLEIKGNAASTEIHFLLRDFTSEGLADKRRRLQGLCSGLAATEPRAEIRCECLPSYRNLAESLREDRRPVDLALAATRAAGLTPSSPPFRGCTDGSTLSERGLPTPNLSNGCHNCHGPLEWASVDEMEAGLRVCLELVQLWAREGVGYRGYQPE